MPKVDVYDISGNVIGDIELSESIFGITVNKNALHTTVLNQLSNMRQGTQSTKTKSEVRGGGRKPHRQKGTGKARLGSIRSAQCIKGGIIFGPKPRNFSFSINKKVKRLALKSALSSKVLEQEIIVLDDLSFNTIKTRQVVDALKNLKVDNSAVIVLSEKDENIQKSARNIPGIKTLLVNTLNVYDILKHEKFIITKDAVSKVEEVYV